MGGTYSRLVRAQRLLHESLSETNLTRACHPVIDVGMCIETALVGVADLLAEARVGLEPGNETRYTGRGEVPACLRPPNSDLPPRSAYEDLHAALDELNQAYAKLQPHSGQSLVYDALRAIHRAKTCVRWAMDSAAEHEEPEGAA
jgi:hypothetical protein